MLHSTVDGGLVAVTVIGDDNVNDNDDDEVVVDVVTVVIAVDDDDDDNDDDNDDDTGFPDDVVTPSTRLSGAPSLFMFME